MKIVINNSIGEFWLSKEAINNLSYEDEDINNALLFNNIQILNRTDAQLIEIVEKLGSKSNGLYADLKIVEIPDGVDWEIKNINGKEFVIQKTRSWS